MAVMMRSEGFRWVSSAAAAVYSMAITSSVGQDTAASTSSSLDPCDVPDVCSCSSTSGVKVAARTGCKVEGRYAPRFDGLRFLETLVTAHR